MIPYTACVGIRSGKKKTFRAEAQRWQVVHPADAELIITQVSNAHFAAVLGGPFASRVDLLLKSSLPLFCFCLGEMRVNALVAKVCECHPLVGG